MKRYLPVLSALLFLFSAKAWAQSNQTVNNGENTATVNFSGCVYNWTNDKPGIGLAASGTGDISSFKAVNTGNAPIIATITATPVASENAYITSSDNPGTVTVINTATNTVTATINVGKSPLGVSASPDGSRVYVANTFSNSVSVINTLTNTVVATVPVGNYPYSISVSYDGSEVYAGNVNDNSVSVISTASNKVTATITGFKQPFGLKASTTTNLLYVTNSANNTISVANTTTGKITKTITVGDDPWQIAVTPDGNFIYVTNISDNTVSVVSAATNTVIKTIPVGLTPEAITISPDGSLVYVGIFNAGNVTVISTATNTVVKTLSVYVAQGLSLTPDGKTIYVVNNNAAGTVTAINTATGAIVATVPTGADPISYGNFIATATCAPVKFTITVNPTSATPPTITASAATGTISACAGTASTSPQIQLFTVSGSNLTANITAAAPAGFEVSLSAGNGYGSSVTVPETGGAAANTTVYVRSASSDATGPVSGNITLTSSGATSQNVAVTGTVNALPTVNTVPPQSVNNGAPTTAINFTGTASTFTWTNDTPGIGLAGSGSGNIAPFTAVNTGAVPVVANITVTPVTPGYAYIASADDGRIDVINTTTNTVVAGITLNSQFFGGISVSPDGTRLYITNTKANTVSVINTATNTVIATIPVGTSPGGVAVSPDGSKVYVANPGSGTISVVSSSTNTVAATIQGIGASYLVVSPDGSRLYTDGGAVINTSTNAVIAMFPGGGAGMAISPNGGLLYIPGANDVSVVNTSTYMVVATIAAGTIPVAIAVSPDGSAAYVVNQSSNTVSVISTATNTVAGTINVGSEPAAISITPDGSEVYVTNIQSNTVSVINTATNTVIATVRAGDLPWPVGNFVTGAGCIGIPVKFTITVNPTSAAPPTINAGTATGTISACAGTASASPQIQQFTLSGSNLTGNITATAPPGFEVSLNANSGFGRSVILTESGGNVNTTVVYVRSASTASAGIVAGNVVLSSPGATSENAAVKGAVNYLPSINPVSPQAVSNGTLTQAVNFTGTGNVFNWTNNTPGIGLAASGTGNIAPFIAVNNGTSPVIATVTATPTSVAYAYVPNSISNNVSVINIANNTVVSTIPVGNYPCSVALSPDGSFVYVTNQRSNSISVISTATNSVVSTILDGQNSPTAIAVSPDGQRLYVVNLNSNTLSVFNAVNNSLLAAIGVGGYPVAVAVTPDGSKVYVSNSSNTITVINTLNYTVKAAITEGLSPNGIAVSPDGSKVYVAVSGANDLSVISTATDAVINTIPVGATPAGVAVSPDGSTVYVSNQFSNNVSVVSTSSNAVVATIPVGTDPVGLSVTSDGSEVYAANQKSGNVSVINTASNSVASTIAVGSYPISLGNFINSGTGCSGTPVTFTITVNPTVFAAITASGTPAPLTTTYGTPSSSTGFKVSGTSLTTGILVTPPAGFEVSTDNVNFTGTVTVGSGGSVAATAVYIRLAAVTPVGSYSGNIQLNSNGASPVEVAMPASTVTPALLTIIADDKSRAYNTPNPILTASYIGFVNFETPASLATPPLLTTAAVTTSPVGRYPITAGGAASPNYTINYIMGTLTVLPTEQSIIIPNTFTPNGDGVNDTWNIKYLDFYTTCSVQIFNRWGQNVYSSIGYGIPWDGTYKGAALPAGTYYYVIDLKNNSRLLSGFVAIIR